MRRLRVEFRPSANVDIATIFEYIFEASRSSAVAGRFIRRIRDRCERIRQEILPTPMLRESYQQSDVAMGM
jgi:plasmid stabilization system protein ParE